MMEAGRTGLSLSLILTKSIKTNTWRSNIQSTLSYYLTYLSIRFRCKIAKYLQIMKTIVYMVIILDQVF